MSTVSHYCQKCLAANPLGQDFCTRCGTRLMIVVEPSSWRYEASEAALSSDEHLLERISAIENRLSRFSERLERGLDLLLRQAQNTYFDRSLVKSLISLLSDGGVVEPERLQQLWSERCRKDAVEQEESIQRDELRLTILARSNVADRRVFEELVNEGFLLIEDKQLTQGINRLQRAAEISTANPALNLFIGEHFFRHGKTKLARTYLSKAHDAMPDDVRISLLLGLTCADEGEVKLAKDLLSTATQRGGSSFAGHYGLGWLFVAEKNWRRAVEEFKRALSIRPSPEAHYVLGCLYYELSRDGLASRHLLKATEMDPNYSEAFYLLSRVYRRTGRRDLAEQTLKKAELGIGVSPGKAGGTKSTTTRPARNAPLFHLSTSRSRKLITGADKRLADALREDALRAYRRPEADAH